MLADVLVLQVVGLFVKSQRYFSILIGETRATRLCPSRLACVLATSIVSHWSLKQMHESDYCAQCSNQAAKLLADLESPGGMVCGLSACRLLGLTVTQWP